MAVLTGAFITQTSQFTKLVRTLLKLEDEGGAEVMVKVVFQKLVTQERRLHASETRACPSLPFSCYFPVTADQNLDAANAGLRNGSDECTPDLVFCRQTSNKAWLVQACS